MKTARIMLAVPSRIKRVLVWVLVLVLVAEQKNHNCMIAKATILLSNSCNVEGESCEKKMASRETATFAAMCLKLSILEARRINLAVWFHRRSQTLGQGE